MSVDRCPDLKGVSRPIMDLKEEIERVASADAKVLITGESGSGKELVARAVHQLSPRSSRPFVAVNCAGLPETLLESELFGHVRGSFTGAYRDKPGKLEIADTGTIFLDEVGEMTLRMQGLLLRFLETGELQKVGADRIVRRVNVRVIAATNRDLHELMAAGSFREDLFYRLNVIHLVVPPLRAHREDIPLLVEEFMRRSIDRNGGGPKTLSEGVVRALTQYSWPGNVRQLQNLIERLVVVARRPEITVDDLPAHVTANLPVAPAAAPARDTIADSLFHKLVHEQESFWTLVYPLYMQREITRTNVQQVIERGLHEARGNYKIVLRLFNMEPTDYKKFLNFLRKHDCQLPFQPYRQVGTVSRPSVVSQ
jgi:transcriptional regulator with PAS, ATPase and Fis domain